MNSEQDHEPWKSELPAYCLGALEPTEAAAFERHLAGCERCRAEVQGFEPALEALAEAVERREPPTELRDRLVSEVRTGAAAQRAASPGLRDRLRGWVTGRPVRWSRTAFAAALLIAGVLVGYAIGAGGFNGGPGGGTTIVAGQPSGIVATVVRDDDGDGGTLSLANVRPLPEERVLEAWLLRDGEVTPVSALFVPDSDGRASTMIEDLGGVEQVMVTREPPGGSASPTSAPIATVPIPPRES